MIANLPDAEQAIIASC